MAKLDRFVDTPARPPQCDPPALVDEIRRSHEEMDHFVRALSHDMSANFMLLEDSFSRLKRSIDQSQRPDMRELATHVEACLKESRRFLNDLVGLAKTGRIAMEPNQVEVGRVLDEVLFEQRDLIDDRGVRVHRSPRFPAVLCNPQRLKQILTNLIRNAILHGCDPLDPQISIAVEAASVAAGGRGRTRPGVFVAFRVHDNGRGIAPQHREEIFLPGRRLAGAATEGSGMGLAIVRKIVEHYGGRVFVEPQSRIGTAIVFTLPSAEGNAVPGSERVDGASHGLVNVACDTPHEPLGFRAHPVVPKTRPSKGHG
jgi:signal transduction histidine kinase